METIDKAVIYSCLIIITLAFLLICFFLMAIWRSILGRSSSTLKLATGMTALGKKMDTLNNSLQSNATNQKEQQKLTKDLTHAIKDIRNENP